ncbi:MAG: FAD-binding oxidoreductase [Endozoicomonas sp.]
MSSPLSVIAGLLITLCIHTGESQANNDSESEICGDECCSLADKITIALEEKKPVRRVSYSSLSTSHADISFLPENAAQYPCFFRELKRVSRNLKKKIRVTFMASGMSFGEQSLPPGDAATDYRISLDTSNLKGFRLIRRKKMIVEVGAGMTWAEVEKKTREDTGIKTIPFDFPSSDNITVGGALASNTFSRTSDIGGNYVSGHVWSFTLIKPDGERINCSRSAQEGSIQRRCFWAVPGSMGALGLVEKVTIELQPISWRDVVHTQVLKTTSTLSSFASEFRDAVKQNRRTKWYDQGLYGLILGNPAEPYGRLIGSKKGGIIRRWNYLLNRAMGNIVLYQDSDFNGSSPMILYGESNWRKAKLIRLAHHLAYTGVPDMVIRLFMSEGSRYTNDIYNYTFYHNGYWEAHGGKSVTEFASAHQAWVVPSEMLESFMQYAGDLLNSRAEGKEYRRWVYPHIMLQDVTPVPRSKMVMSPHTTSDLLVYQITVAIDQRDSDRARHTIAFFRELSEQVAELGVKVHLLKETHVPDELLRSQYQEGIEKIQALREELDPDRVIHSALWQRLDPIVAVEWPVSVFE